MTALVSYSLRYIPMLLTVIISTIIYGANRLVLHVASVYDTTYAP